MIANPKRDVALIYFAGFLRSFGVGLIGVPVLAASAAYALAEAMSWTEGLERKATDARGFYAVIAVSVLAGLLIQPCTSATKPEVDAKV